MPLVRTPPLLPHHVRECGKREPDQEAGIQRHEANRGATRIALAAVCLCLAPTSASAADAYYLRTELAATKAKLRVADAQRAALEGLLEAHDQRRERLRGAHRELRSFRARIQRIKKTNLIKSLLYGAFEAFEKGKLAFGLYGKAVSEVTLEIVVGIAGDQMQNALRSPYSRSVGGFTEEGKKALDEVQRVEEVLDMSLDEVKEHAFREEAKAAGSKRGLRHLGDTAAIFRKIRMLLEETRKAEKAAEKLVRELDRAHRSARAELPEVDAERRRLSRRGAELERRLEEAEAGERERARRAKGRLLLAKVAVAPVRAPPLKSGEREAYIRRKRAELASERARLAREWALLRREVDSSLQRELTTLAGDTGRSRLSLDPATEETVRPLFPRLLRAHLRGAEGHLERSRIRGEHLRRTRERYEEFADEAKKALGPIVGELDSLVGKGPHTDEVRRHLTDLFLAAEDCETRADALDEDRKILEGNLELYRRELAHKTKIARSYVTHFRRRSGEVLEEARHLNAKIQQAIEAVSEVIELGEPGPLRPIEQLQAKVRGLFTEGASGRVVRKLVEQRRDEILAAHEQLGKIKHHRRRRDATLRDLEAWSRGQLGRLWAGDIATHLGGLVDPAPAFREELRELQAYLYQGKHGAASCLALEQALFDRALYPIGELLPLLDEVDKLNARIRATCAGLEAQERTRTWRRILAELEPFQAQLDPWLERYPPVGRARSPYRVLSRQTREALRIGDTPEATPRREEETGRREEETDPPGEEVGHRDEDLRRLVRRALSELTTAYERRNPRAFTALVSSGFLGGRTQLEEGIRFDFELFTSIRVEVDVRRLERRGGRFVVEADWRKTQLPRRTRVAQKTSGSTTLFFTLEDGSMRLIDLRGHLLFATLSPEIAESSGLLPDVVGAIQEARVRRDPVQPGAGETEEGGGASAALVVRTGRVTVPGPPPGNKGFDFSSGRATSPGSGDVDFELDRIFKVSPGAIQRLGISSFSSITEAPFVHDEDRISVRSGDVVLFTTTEGYYGKMEILSVQASGYPSTMTFRYAVQTNGSRALATRD